MDNNLTNIEKLIAFIDGELDSTQTTELLYELAGNYELQEEMRRLIAVKAAFSRSLLHPPEKLQSSIHQKLGFTPVPKFLRLATLFAGIFSFMKSKYSVAVLLLVTGLIITLNIFNKNSDVIESDSLTSNNISKDTTPMVSSELMKSDSDNVSEISRTTNYAKTIPDAYLQTIEIDANDIVRTDNADVPFRQSDVTDMLNIGKKTEEKRLFVIEKSDIFAINGNNIFELPANSYVQPIRRHKFSFDTFLDKTSIYFKKSHTGSLPNFTINDAANPILNEYAIALEYNFNQEHSVGVELGQEKYLMQFEGLENGILMSFKTDYNGFYAGGYYKYIPQYLSFGKYQPYGKIFAGGTVVGPISRLEMGTQYMLTDKIKLFLGLEAGVLVYDYQGYNSSFKYGINYGISFGF